MFLTLTAKNCGNACLKLLTSCESLIEKPRLPFCINNGRSLTELKKNMCVCICIIYLKMLILKIFYKKEVNSSFSKKYNCKKNDFVFYCNIILYNLKLIIFLPI